MRLPQTGDPVRGIGLVAIYFATLEDKLDELLKLSAQLFTLPDNILGHSPFRRKAEWLQKQFRTAFTDYPYYRSDEQHR